MCRRKVRKDGDGRDGDDRSAARTNPFTLQKSAMIIAFSQATTQPLSSDDEIAVRKTTRRDQSAA
jgi:hypothetical protein